MPSTAISQLPPGSSTTEVFVKIPLSWPKAFGPLAMLLLFGLGYPSYILYRLRNVPFQPKLILIYAIAFVLSASILYLVCGQVKRRNDRMEVSPLGLTRITGNGRRIILNWTEVQSVRDSMNGLLTVVAGAGQKIVVSSREYVDYPRLKRRLFEGFEDRTAPFKNNRQTFPMNPEFGKIMLWCGLSMIGFLVFGLAALGMECSQNGFQLKNIVLMSLSIPLFGGAAYYCLGHGLRVAKSRIELSDDGIARVEKDGSSVQIRWNQVTRVLRRGLMRQLAVYGGSDSQKILVDYQFDRFDTLQDRILQEYGIHLSDTHFPMTIGKLPVMPYWPPLLIYGPFAVWPVWALIQHPGKDVGSFTALLALFSGFLVFLLFKDAQAIKAVTLRQDMLVLCRLFGAERFPWGNISSITMELLSGQHDRSYQAVLALKGGKTFRLNPLMRGQPEAYVRIRRVLEERSEKENR